MSLPPLSVLSAKLKRLAPLSDEDERALLSLPHRVAEARARDFLVREGQVPQDCCLLVKGVAARSKLTADGCRQIVSFHIAGDVLDLQHLFLDRADHDVQTITAAEVVWIPMADLRSLQAERPAIATALWRDALIDASIFREWVLNVGRRDAKTRIAHMLSEYLIRSAAAGLGAPDTMSLPFTQEEIGDATGLTPVHVNRMLRELEEQGLMSRAGRAVRVVDWPGFRQVATFDPAYLHAAA